MSCFPLPYGIIDAQWHISHFSGCITNTPQVCQWCDLGKGRHTPTHIYTYTQHTQHTHKVHLCIYSIVCAVQGMHTTCQVTYLDLPCRWKHQNKLQPPVCLLVSSVWQCLSSSPSATLNYPRGEAMPHLHQMVSHITIAVS